MLQTDVWSAADFASLIKADFTPAKLERTCPLTRLSPSAPGTRPLLLIVPQPTCSLIVIGSLKVVS